MSNEKNTSGSNFISIGIAPDNSSFRPVARSPEYTGVTMDRIRLAFSENKPKPIPYPLRFELSLGFVVSFWGTFATLGSEKNYLYYTYLIGAIFITIWGAACLGYWAYCRFYLKESGELDIEKIMDYIENGKV